MKKNFLLGLSALALAGFGTFATKTAVVAHAEDEIESVPETSIVSEVEETPESETIHVYTEEELLALANSIYEKVEAEYDAKIRDKYMFGISLGSLIGSCFGLLMMIYNVVKTKDMNKSNSSNGLQLIALKNELLQFKNLVEEQKNNYDKMIEAERQVAVTYKNSLEVVEAKLVEATEKLEKYATVDIKLDTIIENQKLLSQAEEYVVSGVSEQIADNAEAVE